MDLKIVENPKHTKISEAFGMTDAMFDSITQSMAKYFSLAIVEHIKHEHAPGAKCNGQSKTKELDNYLQSKEFKAHKWTPKTANDYFILGFIFNMALDLEDKMMHAAIDHFTGSKGGKKTIEIGHGITIQIG